MNQQARVLAGRYEIGDLIGRGGMAEVHIGYDTRLGRTVAIKMLRSDLARDPSFQTRFRREAQAAAGLNHPTIVAVYDTGEDTIVDEATGQRQTVPFIVMEYVEGHTVRDILKGDVAAPIDEAVEIVIGVLTALDYSHHAGLVHRDIKPANVMLTPTGAVKVMDFGIARALADAGQTMTQAQAVVGTAQYLSPEQARGENVDARSDLYSTGCLLFELLTGRPPFVGDSPVSVAYQHVREPAPAPSEFAADVPPALDGVVLKALAKTKEDRYGSAREFLADLRAVMADPHGSALAAAGGVGGGPTSPVSPEATATQATELMNSVPPTQPTAVMPPGIAPGTAAWQSTGAPQSAAVALDHGYDDEEEERRRRRRQFLILGASAAAAIALIVLLFVMSRGGGTEEPTLVAVPGVVGLTEEAAIQQLTLVELDHDVVYETSDEVGVGRVISSNPPEGEEVDQGTTVVLTVSSGQDLASVPSVRGLQEDDARQLIEEANLVPRLEVEVEHDPVFEEGVVTRTDPVEGTDLPAGSEVTLYVASGQVDLPELVGMSEEGAMQILRDLRLRVSVIDVETTETRPGEVLAQSPRAGLVPRGSEVEIEVSAEPRMNPLPDVTGQTQSGATANLEAAGFGVDVTEQYSETTPAGRVISQSPPGNTQVRSGTVVTIIVSLGPPPPPDPPDPPDPPGPPGPSPEPEE